MPVTSRPISRRAVLDVACGRGAVRFPAAERVTAAGDVVGIALVEEVVQATNAEAQRRQDSRKI
jgi:O-methyltransferase/aklanonic acid methyltransferase